MKRVFKVFLVSVLILIITVNTALAIVAPNTMVINTVDAYQSVYSTGDQLHIISYEISYAVDPTDYTAEEAFLFIFSGNSTEIAVAVPYAYFNEGYSQGVIGFYFTPSQAPVWQSDNLSIRLVGNPAIDWGGDPPSVTFTSWNSWNTLRILVGARIRTLASQLEDSWVTIDLISTVQGVKKLTSYGSDYFTTTIPNIQDIAPEVFLSATTLPDIPTENKTTTYGDSVEARWLTSGNGTFEFTPTANLFSTSTNWIKTILFLGFSFGVLIAASLGITRIRTGGAGDITGEGLRPALFLFGALLVIGSFMGFMPFEIGLWVGILGGLAVVLALFWRGAA